MKIFKILLILILLVSLNIFVCGNTENEIIGTGISYNQGRTQKEIIDWQESYGSSSTTGYWKYIDKYSSEPKTLLEWFENLSLNEKVDIYNHWRKGWNGSVIYFQNDSDDNLLDCIK